MAKWLKGIFLFSQTLSPLDPHVLSYALLCCPTVYWIPNKLSLTSNNTAPLEMPRNEARAAEESKEAPLHWPLTKELLPNMISKGSSTLYRPSINGFPLTRF